MNERFTYVYDGIGWDVENEYINSIKEIMKDYNLQEKKLEDIKTSMVEYKFKSEKLIDEEEIRHFYNKDREFFPNYTYEAYRKNYLEYKEKQKLEYAKLLELKEKEYNNEFKQLINFDLVSIQKLHYKKRELEYLLEENEIKLRQNRLDWARTDIESRANLNDEYDKIFLEIKKIKHALSYIEELIQKIRINREEYFNPKKVKDYSKELEEYKVSLEEYKKMLDDYKNDLNKLNELSSNYDVIDKEDYERFAKEVQLKYEKISNKYNEISGLYNKLIEKITKENDGLSEEELNKTINGIEKPEEPEKPQIIEMSNEYMEALEEYKESLRIYREELLELYELQAKLEKGEIKFSEYEQFAKYMVERHIGITEKYNGILELYDKEKQRVSDKYSNLEPEQLEEKLNTIEKPEEPEKPQIIEKIDNKEHKPWLLLRSAAAISAGIGAGALVHFALNPIAGGVVTIGALAARLVVGKKRSKAKKLEELQKVSEINKPTSKLKEKIQKVKNYLKSQEGLRDMSWALNSMMITTLALQLFDFAYDKFADKDVKPNEPKPNEPTPNEPTPVEPTPNEPTPVEPTPNEPTPVEPTPVEPTNDVGIGDTIDGHNIEYGHDTADYAINDINSERLMQGPGKGATIDEFMTPDGQSFTSGTLKDVMDKTGLDPSQIAVKTTSVNGDPYAWLSADQLIDNISQTLGRSR